MAIEKTGKDIPVDLDLAGATYRSGHPEIGDHHTFMMEDSTLSSLEFNDIDIDIEQDAQEQAQVSQRTMWGMLGLGLAIGLIGMNLVIANPLIQRIDQMQRDIAVLQRNLKDLSDAGDGIAGTNSLLSGLAAQRKQIADARISLDQIQALHKTLLSRTAQTETARQGVERLITLQDNILDQRELTVPAQKALDQATEMQRQIIASQSQVESARSVVEKTRELHHQIVREMADVSSTNTAVQGMIDLKSMILTHANDTDLAQSKFQAMVDLFSRITNSKVDLDVAGNSLGQLIELKDRLVKETDGVISAVQTLEILGDFQDEFKKRISALQNMQQDLMSIVMMETTIGRVAKALEPMLELGDLRRLSASEVREAARTILDRRGTNIADKAMVDPKPAHVLQDADVSSDLEAVPEPREIQTPRETLTK